MFQPNIGKLFVVFCNQSLGAAPWNAGQNQLKALQNAGISLNFEEKGKKVKGKDNEKTCYCKYYSRYIRV